MARRVTESITSSTLAPWSRKYSATASATKAGAHAQRRRPVRSGAHHHRALAPFRPQFLFQEARAPRGCARRSCAITVTSAELWRAIAPSSVLLPTPLPPKMPMRWPLPQGSQAVDGADAGHQRLGDVLAVERIAGRAVEAVGFAPRQSAGRHRSACRSRRSRAPAAPGRPARAPPPARATTRSPSCRPSISSSGMEARARCGTRSPGCGCAGRADGLDFAEIADGHRAARAIRPAGPPTSVTCAGPAQRG